MAQSDNRLIIEREVIGNQIFSNTLGGNDGTPIMMVLPRFAPGRSSDDGLNNQPLEEGKNSSPREAF